MNSKIRVNISISEETHQMLKARAASTGTSVSQVITDLIHEKGTVAQEGTGWGYDFNCSRVICIRKDTDDRLEQWAYENHTTVDQGITDWIWKQKVKQNNIRGQMRLY